MASSRKSEFAEMQKEFMAAISESSARLAGMWMDALRRASALMEPRERRLYSQAFSPHYPAGTLSKMIEDAAADLPALMLPEKDRKEVRRIKQRWLESYENWICDIFGIPSRSQALRLADQWRGLLGSFSHGNFAAAGGQLALLFSPVAWAASGWPFLRGDHPVTGMFDSWVGAYSKAFQDLFLPQRQAVSGNYEMKVRRAFEAQVKFFDFLPEFQEQLMVAAKKGLENVLRSIASAGATEITPEVYRGFVETWIANHEKEFMDLFLSEPFRQALTEVVRLAGTARQRMDSLLNAGLSVWDVPSRKELAAISQAVESLRAEVRDLQNQLHQLRGLLQHEVRETDSNGP